MRPRSSRSPRTSAPERVPDESGHTLVELIIASALLLLVIVTVLSALDNVSNSQAYQADRSVTLDDMRNVINRMTKDLRQATSINDCTATPSTVTFTTYINGVGTVIVYNASGTTLTRKVGSGSAFTVLKNLASTSIFTCTSASDVTGVQWVEIDLKVTPKRSPTTTLELDSEVNLRNRTANLTGSS
ncbi:MAG: hypothetical protein ACXVK4_06295 [Acidimicrobiia bacterium]